MLDLIMYCLCQPDCGRGTLKLLAADLVRIHFGSVLPRRTRRGAVNPDADGSLASALQAQSSGDTYANA